MTKFYQKVVILGLSFLVAWAGWKGLNALAYQGEAAALNQAEGRKTGEKINKPKPNGKKSLLRNNLMSCLSALPSLLLVENTIISGKKAFIFVPPAVLLF